MRLGATKGKKIAFDVLSLTTFHWSFKKKIFLVQFLTKLL